MFEIGAKCQKFSIIVVIAILVPITLAFNENIWYNNGSPTPKYCSYQGKKLPMDKFNKMAGYGCYSYGSAKRYKNAPYNNTVVDAILVGLYDNGTHILQFTYDYKNETVQKIILESFVSDKYFKKWMECSKNADDCCSKRMTNENIVATKDNCPAIWDAWSCFDPGELNTNSTNYCPNYATMSDPPCVLTSYKECYNNSRWNPTTDYTTCIYTSVVRDRQLFHVYALAISIIFCIPAIMIFFIYPSLRITRVILHRNLLLSIVVKNILVILSKVLITLDAMKSETGEETSLLVQNGVACKVLAYFERAAINAMYACMLVDGFYLHKIIVAVFRKDPPMYMLYSAVAVLSIVPISIWAALKATQDDVFCWVVDESYRQWVIDGSRYAMLGINLVLLLDIIRVLVWKLKRNNGAQHTKTTLRATFILLPLFGIQFIMMSQRPVNATCLWDNVFYYISYVMDSSQGILVSLLYCYFNKEVQILLNKSYYRFRNYMSENMFFNLRHQTQNARRSTAATYVAAKDNSPRQTKFMPRTLEPIREILPGATT